MPKLHRANQEATLAITAVRQSFKTARAETLPRRHGHVQAEDSSVSPSRGRTAASPAEELPTAPVVSAPSSRLETVAADAATVASRSGLPPGIKTPPPDEVHVHEPFRRSGDADSLGDSIAGMTKNLTLGCQKRGGARVVRRARLLKNEFQDPMTTVDMVWRHMATNSWHGQRIAKLVMTTLVTILRRKHDACRHTVHCLNPENLIFQEDCREGLDFVEWEGAPQATGLAATWTSVVRELVITPHQLTTLGATNLTET